MSPLPTHRHFCTEIDYEGAKRSVLPLSKPSPRRFPTLVGIDREYVYGLNRVARRYAVR